MQPFLAYNLQTDTQTINLVWTLGFLGFLIGSLITSHIFTRYLRTSLRKLMFMSSVMLLTGLATLCLPFIMNLPLLLMARFIQVFKYTLKRHSIFSSVSRIWTFSDCRQCCVSIHTGTWGKQTFHRSTAFLHKHWISHRNIPCPAIPSIQKRDNLLSRIKWQLNHDWQQEPPDWGPDGDTPTVWNSVNLLALHHQWHMVHLCGHRLCCPGFQKIFGDATVLWWEYQHKAQGLRTPEALLVEKEDILVPSNTVLCIFWSSNQSVPIYGHNILHVWTFTTWYSQV